MKSLKHGFARIYLQEFEFKTKVFHFHYFSPKIKTAKSVLQSDTPWNLLRLLVGWMFNLEINGFTILFSNWAFHNFNWDSILQKQLFPTRSRNRNMNCFFVGTSLESSVSKTLCESHKAARVRTAPWKLQTKNYKDIQVRSKSALQH